MQTWLDRVTMPIAPRWTLRRVRARIASEVLQRHYDAAGAGRRTQGWRRSGGDANAAVGSGLSRLREQGRDLVRNNAYAESAVSTIVDQAVGWGIMTEPEHPQAALRWSAWAETTACDAAGRHDFAGLQKLVMRTAVVAGEALVRRRWRRAEDGLPIPIQLQVLEPDFLDLGKEGETAGGGQIIQGVEFDGIGRRVAYWLFPQHPGAARARFAASERVPASDLLHVFKASSPEQVRAVSWFAPVILRMHDLDDYLDASLMKQKIAACLAVITTDTDGSAPALGAVDPKHPEVEQLEPGMIANIAPGRSVEVVQPPSVTEHAAYTAVTLREIATGLGITYEDLTGDYTGMPFSAARMSRLRQWARVEDWRWRMLVPQLCDPVWRWAMQAAAIIDAVPSDLAAEWTAPPAPMIDPANEGLAYQRLIRSGLISQSEALRERGYRAKKVLAEMAADNALIDRLKLILDSDPRRTTQAGNPRETGAGAAPERALEAAIRTIVDERLAAVLEERLAHSQNGVHA